MTAPAGYLSQVSTNALQGTLFKNTLFAIIATGTTFQVLLPGPADVDAPILIPAHPVATTTHVPILMYHHVDVHLPLTSTMNAYGKVLATSLTVLLPDFQQQLDWLQQQGYHTINQTELFDALYYGKSLPSHPIILSFDDGYQDTYTYALPALLSHHFRGVFYIITGMIGGEYMTWDQVRTLARDGMQIASHTIHHVNVAAPPAGMTMHNELELSKQTLEEQTGMPVQFFCYPSGAPFQHGTSAQKTAVTNELIQDGYVSATLDPTAITAPIDSTELPYQLPRIRVNYRESAIGLGSILHLVTRMVS
jgi:peptidoglycan/xylan/chitin deacetylase (PgdA/CDA1 family)